MRRKVKMVLDQEEYLKTVRELQKNGIALHNNHSYCGDNIDNSGDEFDLLCVASKKQIREHLKIPLSNVWNIRCRLHFARKVFRLHKKTNQPNLEVQRSRRAMLNSMFNEFYINYKYGYRLELIHKLNFQKLMELNEVDKDSNLLKKVEDYCLSHDYNFSIGWQKVTDWYVEIYTGYQSNYEKKFYVDGCIDKEEALKAAIEWIEEEK